MPTPSGIVIISAGSTGRPFRYTYQGGPGGAKDMANWVNAPASGYGVPSGTSLKVFTATDNPSTSNTYTSELFTINVSGTYTGYRFERRVRVLAGNVTFANCYFAGTPGDTTTQDTALLLNNVGNGVGPAIVTAYRCTFKPDTPYDSCDGIRGSRLTIDGCEITGTSDGAQFWGSGQVTVKNSWFHYFPYYDNDSHGPPVTGTHNDAMQISSGPNYLILNNLFDSTINNAAMYISQALGATSSITIEGNTFNLTGNPADLNLNDAAGDGPVAGLTIKNNIFKHDESKYQMLISNRTKSYPSTSITGNVWADGSLPPPTAHGGS